MPTERDRDLSLEIGHVLFIDIVGYSKLLINEQSEVLEHLNGMVRGSEQVRAAEADGKLIRLATGDGMALVFRGAPEAPVRCAVELSRAIKQRPELRVRMGIHSGPISEVIDVNERTNVAGPGINLAQRVMDCGDAGHVLLSKRVADDLAHYRHWQPLLHELGECEVKHGMRIAIVNLYSEDIGNPARPEKFRGPDASLSIAVLPFSDMSAAKDQEYLCEGMAEEIMNALMRIEGFRVASRTSAFRAGRSGDDLVAIARALSVGHVLEGSVRTASGRIRVTAQLTDVASGYQLWSERFDRETVDVFAIQDEIAAGVVEAVKARLAPASRTIHARPQAVNLDAYRSFLKGRHLRGVEDFGGALRAFEEAVRIDPAHAPSWTGLAEITVLSAHMGMIQPRAACTAARKMLATAEELQGESAEGLHVEAFAAFLDRAWGPMETAWRRAIELQHDHVLALGSFALTLCGRQRLAEAMPFFARAKEADPLASFPYMVAGWGLLVSGKPEEALREIDDALAFQKDDASAISALCVANIALGRIEEGILAGERGVAVAYRAPYFLGLLGWALATAGRDAEARSVLDELRARPPGAPTAVSEAWLLGALGKIDDAFDVLARAEDEHQGLLCYTGMPGFDSLRDDARFAALLRRLGLAPA
jgi:TolB-like protein/Tfp pilus assembly protein PilF